jgi:hypothetical protein
MVGKSTCGRGATGKKGSATQPDEADSRHQERCCDRALNKRLGDIHRSSLGKARTLLIKGAPAESKPALTLQAACHDNGAVNQTQCEKRAKPSSPGLAAWGVHACGVNGIARAVENTGQARTSFANGANFLRRAVRDITVEY